MRRIRVREVQIIVREQGEYESEAAWVEARTGFTQPDASSIDSAELKAKERKKGPAKTLFRVTASSLAISGECTTTLHIGPNISIWYENITREILGWVAKKPSVPPSQKAIGTLEGTIVSIRILIVIIIIILHLPVFEVQNELLVGIRILLLFLIFILVQFSSDWSKGLSRQSFLLPRSSGLSSLNPLLFSSLHSNASFHQC
ncbi:hypothetical protein PRIPAC_95590 [Pristionchus pacificus]|uniref:Uncharacterized protein n=1 Tax=Pristionchus pacificus TaxID=54126 RepID=A0A2A6CUC8_PRIPA|nr:hypothetical protein PRIPAC_95590 [Pristionchus pacificus]|eukprot:PDM81686.1 hypothetical protein PRIPAC_30667 [Pristionchus pacificus]